MNNVVDQYLLERADRFVAWNAKHGRWSQWDLSLALIDLMLVLMIANGMLAYAQTPTLGVALPSLLVCPTIAIIIRHKEVSEIARLRRSPNGSLTARLRYPVQRTWCVTALPAFTLITLGATESLRPSDFAYIAAIITTAAAFYLKAAATPPPAFRTEPKAKIVTV